MIYSIIIIRLVCYKKYLKDIKVFLKYKKMGLKIKSKDREIIEKFLIDKGKLLLRKDLDINHFENLEDSIILGSAEFIKGYSNFRYEHAIVYKLPVFGEGDQISKDEINCYMRVIPYMLEKIGFKEFIKDYLIIFNYFVQDFVDEHGNMIKLGSLRAVVLFDKPKAMTKDINNLNINYNWLLDNKNKDYIFPYVLFTGYQGVYLNVFYAFIKKNSNFMLKQNAEKRSALIRQFFDTIFFNLETDELIKNTFKNLAENYYNEYFSQAIHKQIDLVSEGFLRKEEVIQYYKKDTSLHLHRNFEIYTCKFVSEDVYNEKHTLKIDPITFQKNKEFFIEQMQEKNKSISMETDWRYFLSVVYALENALLLESRGKAFTSSEKNISTSDEVWFGYKTILTVGKSSPVEVS